MDKQICYSRKPIKLLVFVFTTFFTVLFLVLFPTWAFRTLPLFHVDSHDISFSSTPVDDVQSLMVFGNTSSEDIVKRSYLIGSLFGGDEVSSRIADEDIGNVSMTPFGKNLLVNNSFNVSLNGNSDSAVDNSEKLGHRDDSINNMSSSSYANEEFHELKIDSSSGRKPISSRNHIEENNAATCDITNGKWVIDESYPLYTNFSCPYIDEGFSCETNGRLDNDYMKWRWQPQDCEIPRFNATKMLDLIRGKRLVFVGDSINRNQWESMLCLLMGAVKDPKKVHEAHRRKITKEKGDYSFRFEEYQCTVEYYVTHFLVREGKARVGKKRVQTLRIDSIDKGSSRWKGADILVFNTAHWWSHYKTKSGINYYQEGDLVHPQLDVTVAFKRALLTWASWADKYINTRKTRIFFRSSAPSHFRGGSWNAGGHCKEALHLINNTIASNYPVNNLIVQGVIRQMKNPVTFLDITNLSDYRIDGHPSIYGRKPGNGNKGVQDCSHWCLPGVPDNWNELLLYYLQLEQRTHS